LIINSKFFKLHDLQTRLTGARDTNQQLKDQLNNSDAERRHFEQQATSYKLQIDELRRQFDDTANERTNMEKLRLVSYVFLPSLSELFFLL
jgi:predicted  nucleic acid-binding Zn-ribbon protein